MPAAYLDALRFLKGWTRPKGDVRLREVWLDDDEEGSGGGGPPIAATLVEPSRSRLGPGGRPVGWVVLHGLTRPGREHASLLRFVRAVASTGGRVLIPEIREWTELHFAPERAQSIMRTAVRAMADDPANAPGGVILAGFSFGAPQALLLGSDPAYRTHLRGIVGWGGYADLDRTVRFHFTGEHTWKGETHQLRPDPYGRWVVGANTLPLSPQLPDPEPVAEALRELALDAGARSVMAWDPVMEGTKRYLRRRLPRRLRGLYDLFAPEGDALPDRDAAMELVDLVLPAARREMPLLDPLPLIEAVRVPVRLHHGRTDHLIPFTETLALAEALARRAPDLESGVTGLFSHSGGASRFPLVGTAREAFAFLQSLAGIFGMARG
jgi:hypothetical protein